MAQHRLCFFLSALVPFLFFQFYVLHKLTDRKDATERIAYQLGTTLDSVILHTQKKSIRPIEEDRPLPFSWSACLLIKDNNIILPEWLAYHYTVLPLRRLIVGVDPSSDTDPQSIFDLYGKIGMNITVWRNHSYWIDGGKPHEKKEWHPSEEEQVQEFFYRYQHDRLVYHQKTFYTQCLRQLKSENRTWTTIIDTDEYLAFNYYDPKEGPTTWCENNSTCNEEYLATIKSGAHFRAKLNQSGTAAEFIAKNVKRKVPSGVNPRLAGVDDKFDNPDEPCIVLSRFLIGSKDIDRSEIQRGVDEGFDAINFHTLRFRYRGLYPQVAKCIVDASRSPRFMIQGPHRLYKRQCTGGNAYVHNAAMSFRIHHYIGSWETWRLRGGRGQFNERNKFKMGDVIDHTTAQFSSPEDLTWLSQFVKLVGKETALELTQRIRLREEWNAERNLLKLNKIIH